MSHPRCVNKKVKVKWSRYRPGVAQRVGRGIALLFHDRGTKRGWVVSSTPRPHFTPGKDPVPIVQEAGWAPGPVWTGGKSRLHRDSIPDRPVRSQSLYRLSHRAHPRCVNIIIKYVIRHSQNIAILATIGTLSINYMFRPLIGHHQVSCSLSSNYTLSVH